MSKKRHSKRKEPSSPPSRPVPWPALLLVGALVLMVGGGLVIWNVSNTAPEVASTPKLVVDDTVIDEGYLIYDTPVQTAFRLRNEGEGPLKILGQPEVVLAEGCWPPKAVVSSTTIDPGQDAWLMMDYTMPEGMGGPHEFQVHVRTNDPVEPEMVLIAKSDWGP